MTVMEAKQRDKARKYADEMKAEMESIADYVKRHRPRDMTKPGAKRIELALEQMAADARVRWADAEAEATKAHRGA